SRDRGARSVHDVLRVDAHPDARQPRRRLQPCALPQPGDRSAARRGAQRDGSRTAKADLRARAEDPGGGSAGRQLVARGQRGGDAARGARLPDFADGAADVAGADVQREALGGAAQGRAALRRGAVAGAHRDRDADEAQPHAAAIAAFEAHDLGAEAPLVARIFVEHAHHRALADAQRLPRLDEQAVARDVARQAEPRRGVVVRERHHRRDRRALLLALRVRFEVRIRLRREEALELLQPRALDGAERKAELITFASQGPVVAGPPNPLHGVPLVHDGRTLGKAIGVPAVFPVTLVQPIPNTYQHWMRSITCRFIRTSGAPLLINRRSPRKFVWRARPGV